MFKIDKKIFTIEYTKGHAKKIISLKESSSKLAFSIAIGFFIGLIIPIGLQTIVLIPLAMALQINTPLSLAATLISNPVTAIPIYYSAFEIGKTLTDIDLPFSRIISIMENPTFEGLLKLSKNGLTAFFVGSAIQAILFSILSYVIFSYLISYYRDKQLVK
ncbi:MAG: DUF2062 domain-containing protein [Tenericutes bacterium]|nr:DUF2062 domain-containing protein [Mycoplasmatota bacterium]MBI9009670.1 DUF2062 domain-containing protein [Mycoplasmatota bacterium]